MTIKEIVKKYLEDNGFGGLVNASCFGTDGCGGTLDDFMPCESCESWGGIPGCEPGYVVKYPNGEECPCGEGCYFHVSKTNPNF